MLTGTTYQREVDALVGLLVPALQRVRWSYRELVRRSGLRLDQSTLRRKLRGETPMTTREWLALAAVLGVVMVPGSARSRASRRAAGSQGRAA